MATERLDFVPDTKLRFESQRVKILLRQFGFGDEALATVREGMRKVTNEPGGTGFPWRITEPGYEMAGKTGTAQVRVFTREERARGLTKNENLEWKMRDHALFVGYAPVINPRYAIVNIIEHGAIGHVPDRRPVAAIHEGGHEHLVALDLDGVAGAALRGVPPPAALELEGLPRRVHAVAAEGEALERHGSSGPEHRRGARAGELK